MTKLQKRFAYQYKDKEHYKYVVTIPIETVEELGWKEGNELDLKVQGNTLILGFSDSTRTVSKIHSSKVKLNE